MAANVQLLKETYQCRLITAAWQSIGCTWV